MKPYIKNTADIYGAERIDNLLEGHREILHKHPKLWLNNAEELQEILNKGLNRNIKRKIQEISEKKEKFIWCKIYDSAVEKLERENILVIVGNPGVGKTTLAEMLLLKYVDLGYKITYTSDNNIKNLEDIICDNDKEIIFLDDFLGSNILSYFNNSNDGNELVEFIKRWSKEKNKYIILTSRITLFNEANRYSDKFERLKLDSKRKFLIEITHQSKLEKAQILYTHIKYSDLGAKNIGEILENKYYRWIIEHKNYYPRLIEFITDIENFYSSGDDSYLNFIKKSLENPTKIWEHAFRSNITEDGRNFLITLFSFEGKCELEILEKAFYSRNEYLKREYSSEAFKSTLRILEASFIKLVGSGEKVMIEFQNPSIMDFMIEKFLKSNRENEIILESAIEFQQINYIIARGTKKDTLLRIIIKKYFGDKSILLNKKKTINLFKYIFNEKFREEIEEIFYQELLYLINQRTIDRSIDIFFCFENGIQKQNQSTSMRWKENIYRDDFCEFSSTFKNKIKKYFSTIETIDSLRSYITTKKDLEIFIELLEANNLLEEYFYEFQENISDTIVEIAQNYYDEDYTERALWFLEMYNFNIAKGTIISKINEEIFEKVQEDFSDIENLFSKFNINWFNENILNKIENLSIGEYAIEWNFSDDYIKEKEDLLEYEYDWIFDQLV